MNILWFTNIPMPEMRGENMTQHAGTGGWMMALLDQLSKQPDINLNVACVARGLPTNDFISQNGVRLISISQGNSRRYFQFRSLDDNPKWLKKCGQIVKKIDPDIIHVHGTERFYGLLGAKYSQLNIPILISLQGLLKEYIKPRNYFGSTSFWDIFACHNPVKFILGIGPLFSYIRTRKAAKCEIKILKENRWFSGRTGWDHDHLVFVNPEAYYFPINEVLRPSFYTRSWDIRSCQTHRIVMTNIRSFCRGAEVMLNALVGLKNAYPDICLSLPGGVETTPYGKRLIKRIQKLGIEENVEFPGAQNEKQMADELRKAHVFSIASFIENSPNSLCEAQLIGLPCVVSYVGGVPSLVNEGETGLFFPAGDAAVLAGRINEIFTNSDLAIKLGSLARELALSRHDPKKISNEVHQAYKIVISRNECAIAP